MLLTIYHKIERCLTHRYFAVIAMGVVALLMAIATVVENSFGFEFAQKLIYQSWIFLILLFLLFFSILLSLLRKLPFRKKFIGLYLIYSGILLIGLGALLTYNLGIQGQLSLLPNIENRNVKLSEDVLVVKYLEKDRPPITKEYRLPDDILPASLFFFTPRELSKYGISFKRFIPFAKYSVKLVPKKGIESALVTLSDSRISLDLALTTEMTSNFNFSDEVSGMTFYLAPEKLLNCLFPSENKTSSKMATFETTYWNKETNECGTKLPNDLTLEKTRLGNSLVTGHVHGEYITIYPAFGPYPIGSNYELHKEAPILVFMKEYFKGKKVFFVSNKSFAYYNGQSDAIERVPFAIGKKIPIGNGINIELADYQKESTPISVPTYALPEASSEAHLKAIEINLNGRTNYILNERNLIINIDNTHQIEFIIDKKGGELPFGLTLEKFNIKKVEGSEIPASFQSIGTIQGLTNESRFDITMNHPQKIGNFRLFQSSYFPINETSNGAVLGVASDPGRMVKYLGSITLLLGALIQFFTRKRSL